jgi:hypothetical protein
VLDARKIRSMDLQETLIDAERRAGDWKLAFHQQTPA